MLIALGDQERNAVDSPIDAIFIEQMKRRRRENGLTQGDLASRATALGENMYQQTIAKLESGQRSLKLTEADALARALGTTVHEMLADGYVRHPAFYVKDSRDIASLEEEIQLVTAQLQQASDAATMAQQAHTAAREAEMSARQQAYSAAVVVEDLRQKVTRLQAYYERLLKQAYDLKNARSRS